MWVRSRRHGHGQQRYELAARHVSSHAGEEQVAGEESGSACRSAHICSGRPTLTRVGRRSGKLRSNWRLLQRLADLVEAVGHDAEGVYRASGELGTGAVFLEHLRVLEHRRQR